jgi:hypothetical protein
MNVLAQNKALWFRADATNQILIPTSSIDNLYQNAANKVVIVSGDYEVELAVLNADVPDFFKELYRAINFSSKTVVVVADMEGGEYLGPVTAVNLITIPGGGGV